MGQASHATVPSAVPAPATSWPRRGWEEEEETWGPGAAASRNTNPNHVVSGCRPETCWVLPVTELAPRQPRAHAPAQGGPGAHGTHLAAAGDVGRGDAHVEMLEHGLCLLPGLEGAVHRHAAPSPDLGPEL